MRRVVAVVGGAVLLLALSSVIGVAEPLLQDNVRFDLGSQLMLRLFGETSDSTASFAAAHGDRASESPLRDLALGVVSPGAKPAPTTGVAFGEERVALRDLSGSPSPSLTGPQLFEAPAGAVHFTMPSPQDDAAIAVSPSTHFTVAYQPVPPQPAISPGPGTLAFTPPQIDAARFAPSSSQPGLDLQPAATDAASGGIASFNVRAGKRSVNLNLSTDYEHLGRSDAQAFSVAAPDSSTPWQLPALGAPLLVPGTGDVSRFSLGAGLSVPVVHGLTLNLNYDAQRLYGGYGPPGLLNVDAMNNSYGGNLTFAIPRISSSLSIGASQDRLGDSILPVNGQTQTREDVNFTVKF